MNPQFYLGLSIALLAFPFGFVVGFNKAASFDAKLAKKLRKLNVLIE